MNKAIFVTNDVYLAPSGGGVQWCTKDYLQTIVCAGIEVNNYSYVISKRISDRFQRRFLPQPFKNLISKETAHEIAKLCEKEKPKWIFLNNTEPLILAPQIKSLCDKNIKLVFLSHGAECTDYLNSLRLNSNLSSTTGLHLRLGKLMLAELELRKHIDGVVCISKEDVVFENWFGTRAKCFLARNVTKIKTDRKPVPWRIGTVGTLNHSPNIDGIRKFASEIEGTNLEFRVIGGPEIVGRQLSEEFACVEYLGRLSDNEMMTEAMSWCAFINPIFCMARGASTKVATALGLGIPVLTTAEGARGYIWCDSVKLAENARELAQMALEPSLHCDFGEWDIRVQELVTCSPSIEQSSETLRNFLMGL